MLVGQVVDIADGEARTSPAGVGAVGGVVGEADTSVQVRVATRILAVTVFVHVGITMFFIVVVVGSIPNGGTTHSDTPTAVFTSDEEHVVQIARVGHGVLLIFEGLVNHGLHLSHGLSGETAVVHVGILVAVDARILEVGDAVGLATRGTGGHLVLVAHDHQEGGSLFVVLFLDEGTDGSGAGTDFIGVVDVQVEALRGLPSIPRLQAFLEHTVGDDQHVNGVLPEVGVFVIDVVAPVEHLVIDVGEIGAEGTSKLVVGNRFVILAVAHFDFDVVMNEDAVGGSVVLHGVDRQGTDLDATHRALDLHLGDGTVDEAFGGVCFLAVGKRHILRLLVLADHGLHRSDFVDAVVSKTIGACAVALYLDGEVFCTVRDSNKLVGSRQHGLAYVT